MKRCIILVLALVLTACSNFGAPSSPADFSYPHTQFAFAAPAGLVPGRREPSAKPTNPAPEPDPNLPLALGAFVALLAFNRRLRS